MQTDQEKTAVVFRIFPQGDVLALFPGIDEGAGRCSTYQHLGQHASARYWECIAATRPAKPSEYRPLKTELERMGYNLEVKKRRPGRLRRRSQRREK